MILDTLGQSTVSSAGLGQGLAQYLKADDTFEIKYLWQIETEFAILSVYRDVFKLDPGY